MLPKDVLIKRCNQELLRHSKVNKFSLHLKHQDGKEYFSLFNYDPTTQSRSMHYIGPKNNLVEEISGCHYLKRAIRHLERGGHIFDVDPNYPAISIPKAYHHLPAFVYKAIGVPCVEEWLQRKRAYSTYHPEEKQYRTDTGIMVRSKSELLIANHLTGMKLPYLYEPMISLCGHFRAPDFQILVPLTYRKLAYEHFGLMDQDNYREDAIKKIQEYQNDGYLLGSNFLFSMESQAYPLNLDQIHANLEKAMSLELSFLNKR